MYQGKFDAKKRGGDTAMAPDVRNNEFDWEDTQEELMATAQDAPNPEAPAPKAPKKSQPAKKAKRGPRTGSVIFYTLYFLFIGIFCGALYYGTGLLDDWLVDYQAAQPGTKSEEVFHELFDDPDWAALYQLCGIEDTAYEGSDAFVTYMENKVADGQLTFIETSAGLSGNKKYYIKLGEEKIGYFQLSGEEKTESGIPHWELYDVSLSYSRNESVTIQKMAGHTAYVNGVALDDSYTIRSIYTVAEQYLPDDLVGLRMETQQLSGLMVKPEITILDENGQALEVTYDEETGIYAAVTDHTGGGTITSAQEQVVIKAGETYALYMIEKAGSDKLLKYFDKNSNVYQAITKMTMWMQNCNGYKFENQAVTDFYSYSDSLFSANVYMDLNVTRTNGTVKTYTVDTTLFFELQGSSWKCTEMTNVDVTKQISEVRITFMNEDVELSSLFYATDTRHLTAPVMSAVEGKTFAGWYRQDTDESGNTTYSLVFTPDENGIVSVPSGYELEPMTLYALFEDATSSAGESEVTQ